MADRKRRISLVLSVLPAPLSPLWRKKGRDKMEVIISRDLNFLKFRTESRLNPRPYLDKKKPKQNKSVNSTKL